MSKLPSHIVNSCFTNVKELKLTTGTQLRDFIYIDDVLSAYLTLVDNVESFKSFTEIQLGTGKSISVKEFVETVHRLTKSSTNLMFGALRARANEPKECVADTAAMRSLGWSPKFSLVEGLEEMIRFEFDMAFAKSMTPDPGHAAYVDMLNERRKLFYPYSEPGVTDYLNLSHQLPTKISPKGILQKAVWMDMQRQQGDFLWFYDVLDMSDSNTGWTVSPYNSPLYLSLIHI